MIRHAARIQLSVAIVLCVPGAGLADVVPRDNSTKLVGFAEWSERGQWNDFYGWSMSAVSDMNGDGYGDLLVGAPDAPDNQYRSGEVFLYLGSANGLKPTSDWHVRHYQDQAQYGHSVSWAGDVNGDGRPDMVIGAPGYDNAFTDEGRAYVYHNRANALPHISGSRWLDGGQTEADFGFSVAGIGDVNGDGYDDILVGAPRHDTTQPNEGRIFLYLGSATGVGVNPAWSYASGSPFARLGAVVARAGDINRDGYDDFVASAPDLTKDHPNEGAFFVFMGAASGPVFSPLVRVYGGREDARLGSHMNTAGDVNGDGYDDLIVGTPEYSEGEHPPNGRALIYYGSKAGLDTDSPQVLEYGSGSVFGHSVAGAGDINGDGFSDVVIGTARTWVTERQEVAMIYRGSAAGVGSEPDQVITFWDLGQLFSFSANVVGAGDVNGDGAADVAVGDALGDVSWWLTNQNEGRVSVYHSLGTRITLTDDMVLTHHDEQKDAGFAQSVSSAGDVDGDGWTDVMVGAYLHDTQWTDAGGVFIYGWSSDGLTTEPIWAAEGEESGDWFGFSVCLAGDVNGDGSEDVIVGAPHASDNNGDEGAVYCYFGSPTGLSNVPDWTAFGQHSGSSYGTSVAPAGDINGDGYADVIVGAFREKGSGGETGCAYVYYGNPSGPAETWRWRYEGTQDGEWLGYAVSMVGDINGDGHGDVAVGAPRYDGGEADEGRVLIFFGSTAGLPDVPDHIVEINVAHGMIGSWVSTAGDVNGDYFIDVAVGAAGDPFSLRGVGSAFVFAGGQLGVSETPIWSGQGDPIDGAYGRAIVGVGDINGDGYGDLAVGDPRFDNAEREVGRVGIHLGTSSGPELTPSWTVTGQAGGNRLGASVAALGDLNGDGWYDFVVGAPGFSPQSGAEGQAIIVCSENAPVRTLRPSQTTIDFTPVPRMGYSDDPSGFGLSFRVTPPPGARSLQIEWDAQAQGDAFTGSNLRRSPARQLTPAELEGSTPVFIKDVLTTPPALKHAKWRVRLLTDSQFMPHSRWFYHPSNASSDATIRIGTQPFVPPAPPPKPPPDPIPPVYAFSLDDAFPNPFNPNTTITFTTERIGPVRVAVYDVSGVEVRLLSNGQRTEGEHLVVWDGRDNRGLNVSSGIYFVRLQSSGQERSRKITLVR